MLEITQKNFSEKVVQANGVTLLECWATWCNPCKGLELVLDQIKNEYNGQLKIGKLNVADSPQLASTLGIISLPTILFFSKGKVIDQVTGSATKQTISKKLDQLLNEPR